MHTASHKKTCTIKGSNKKRCWAKGKISPTFSWHCSILLNSFRTYNVRTYLLRDRTYLSTRIWWFGVFNSSLCLQSKADCFSICTQEHVHIKKSVEIRPLFVFSSTFQIVTYFSCSNLILTFIITIITIITRRDERNEQ